MSDLLSEFQLNQSASSGFDNSYSNLVPYRYNLYSGFSEPLWCGGSSCGGCKTCRGGGVPSCGGSSCAGCNSCRGGGLLAAETFSKKVSNPSEDILRSVKGVRPRQMPKGKKEIDASSEIEDIEVLAEEQNDTPAARQLHRMRKIPKFSEKPGGVFIGSDVNKLLLPDETIIGLDTECNIFGGVSTNLVRRRISQLNGFNETVNNFNYANPSQPGSFNRPFVDNQFYVTYALGNQEIWSPRIAQWATPPSGYTGPTGPNGPVDRETQGLALSINGMVNRVLYLIRQPQPVAFHFPLQNSNCQLPCDIDVCNLDRYGGFYFTEDPVGGSNANYINNIGNVPSGGYTPPVMFGTNILRPGNTMWVRVDHSWPDRLFYQSTAGPFMGGTVIVLGNY